MRRLVRMGTCDRCGKCCEGCLNFKAPNVCQIYETRGQGCRNWPPHPFERPPYCAFEFYDPETGEEVLAYKKPELLKVYAPVQEEC